MNTKYNLINRFNKLNLVKMPFKDPIENEKLPLEKYYEYFE